jgi:hypothetical protein
MEQLLFVCSPSSHIIFLSPLSPCHIDPQSRFLGETTADDLDASGDTAAYKAAGDARWTEWFGTDYAFNTVRITI